MKGERKVKVSTLNLLLMFAGFGLAAWMKAPTELFVAYVVGLNGTAFSFMWGNAQTHKAYASNGKSEPTGNPPQQ